MNTWEQKELELSQRHAEILKIRETILRGTERYYDAQNSKSSSFITDYKKAKERNMMLLNDIERVSDLLRTVSNEDAQSHKHFSTLKANYWGMVRNSFPVWLEEQCLYESKHGLPLSSRSTHDPNLPKQSPRQRNSQGSIKVMESPRPGSRTDTRASNGGDTTRTVPPLELDFSMGEDLTISQAVSQTATLRATTETTPKSALSASGKIKNTNKKVQIKEDKKAKDADKKERERLRKEAEKRRKQEEKERKSLERVEKERKKAEEKERKKSARTPRN